MAGSRASAEEQNKEGPGMWERMFKAKPKPYEETKEKRSTVEQIRDSREATKKAMKEAGIE